MPFDLAELPLPQKSSRCSILRPAAPAALDNPESPTKRSGGLNLFTAPQNTGPFHPTSTYLPGVSPLTRVRTSSFAGFGSALMREPCWSSPSSPAGSPKKVRSVRSRLTSEDCDNFAVLGVSIPTPHASDACGSLFKASPSVSSSVSSSVSRAKPLPQSDVDWLMSTLTEKEVSRFQHRYFVNDCKRRFGELDRHCTGLLGLEELKDALVEMFPTLKLELREGGHHIPALDKALPSLIATFDTDADGSLDFDDFVKFIKFQQAWREQFFLSRSLITSLRLEPLCKSAPLPEPEEISKRPRSAASRIGRRKKSLAKKGSRSEKGSWPSDSATSLPGSTSSISASSTRASSRASSRGLLDSSRGAFYSTMMGWDSHSLLPNCADTIG